MRLVHQKPGLNPHLHDIPCASVRSKAETSVAPHYGRGRTMGVTPKVRYALWESRPKSVTHFGLEF